MGKFSLRKHLSEGSGSPSGQESCVRPILIGVFTSIAGILSGYDAGTIGGLLATRYFVDKFSTGEMSGDERIFTANQGSLLVGILSAGTFVGSLLAAPFGDYLGRRVGLLACCAIFIGGVLLQTASTALPLFVVGRAIAGVGVGVSSVLAPCYQAETVPPWIRGTINSMYQFSLTLGIFLAALIEFGTHHISNTASYRIPVGLQALWAVILFLGFCFLPDTPAYLVKCGNMDGAKKALKFLNGISNDDYATCKINTIKAKQEEQDREGKGTWKQVFSSDKSQRKRLITGIAIMALQQLTGINFIFYFGTDFFKNSGLKNPFVITLITTTVNMLSTFPALYLVEKWGRRSLLLAGAIGMFASQLVVAVVGTVLSVRAKVAVELLSLGNIVDLAAMERASKMSNNVLIAFVCIFIFCFAASWGPLGFVYISEIFPTHLRAKSMALSISSNWLFNLAIAFATPHLVGQDSSSANLGPKIFFIWSGFNFIATIFVYFFIYETKGMLLDDVNEMFTKCESASKSHRYRAKKAGEQKDLDKASLDGHDGNGNVNSEMVVVGKM